MKKNDDKSETHPVPKKNAPGVKGNGKDPSNNKIPVVGIGASAGGLEALEQFFGNMPAKTGMAFIDSEKEKKQFKTKIFTLINHSNGKTAYFVR
jgi:two-component system CheB/CheR fusion protein